MPLFNEVLKYYIERRTTNQLTFIDVLHFVYFMGMSIRYLILAILSGPVRDQYLLYDHVFVVIAQNRLFGRLFFVFFAINFLYAMLSQLKLMYLSDATLWSKWIYQLVIVNWNEFVNKFPDFRFNQNVGNWNKLSVRHIFHAARVQLRMLKFLVYNQKPVYFPTWLAYFPTMRSSFRIRVLITLILLDFVFELTMFLFGKTCPVFLCKNNPSFLHSRNNVRPYKSD